MITSINEFKNSRNKLYKINEGRGNIIIRYDGANWPTYYIDYYSNDADDETGEPQSNDTFFDDVIGNITFFDTVNLDILDKPKEISRDEIIYFENDIIRVVLADNENSMAVGCIPVYDYDEGEEIYDEDKFKEETTKFFKELLTMYNLRKATSAWTSTEVNEIIIEANNVKEGWAGTNRRFKDIKDYSEVQVGDIAFENPDAGGVWDNELGEILWKGTADELASSPYKNTINDWEDDDTEDYDLVVVDLDGFDGGPTLFNYNNDPSGCVVFDSVNESKINENRQHTETVLDQLRDAGISDTSILEYILRNYMSGSDAMEAIESAKHELLFNGESKINEASNDETFPCSANSIFNVISGGSFENFYNEDLDKFMAGDEDAPTKEEILNDIYSFFKR